MTEPLLAIVGPTAAGKTQVALAVAPALGAEIVCADSMTVYRGMDVGTAKPTEAERAAVPHHLLDIRDPDEPFHVAAFQEAARDAIAGIRARGRRPLLVGGSGLYLRAVVDDLSFPPTDPAVRARIEASGDDAALVERLRDADPAAAARIDPANRRRVVRALEVVELTGRPFSSFAAAWERFDGRLVGAGLLVPQPALAERIERRTDAMLAAGLLDEARALLDQGYGPALTAPKAVGYAEALRRIEGTIGSDAELRDEIVRNTKRLARRQMTWFRRDPRLEWFDASDIADTAARIRSYFEEALLGGAEDATRGEDGARGRAGTAWNS